VVDQSRPWVGLEAQLAAADYCRLDGCDALGLAPFLLDTECCVVASVKSTGSGGAAPLALRKWHAAEL
jgi:hypothetical protein